MIPPNSPSGAANHGDFLPRLDSLDGVPKLQRWLVSPGKVGVARLPEVDVQEAGVLEEEDDGDLAHEPDGQVAQPHPAESHQHPSLHQHPGPLLSPAAGWHRGQGAMLIGAWLWPTRDHDSDR